MNREGIFSMLPEGHKRAAETVVDRVAKGAPYMGYPYFAILPAKYDSNTGFYDIMSSHLTKISLKSVCKTSYGFTTSLKSTEIPMLEPLDKIFGTDVLSIGNINDAIYNAIEHSDESNLLKWTYLKKEDMIALKVAELYSTIKYGNLSPIRLRAILNNVAGMCAEYRMFMYDVIDKKVVFPEWFDHLSVEPNRLVSFSDCPQNEKNTFRLCIGAGIANGTGKEGGYVLSDVHALNPCPDKIAPNRLIVQRALTQAMMIVEPNRPIVESGIPGELSSMRMLNMLAARMEYKGYTHEDGIAISKSVAERLVAVEKHLDRVGGTEEDVLVRPVVAGTEFIVNQFRVLIRTLSKSSAVLGRNKIIAIDKFGTSTVTSLKVPGIVTGIVTINNNVYVESLALHEVAIGDKLMDTHGNKGVVSAILPDESMPQLVTDRGRVPIDIVFAPYTVKRCDPSRELEEAISMEVVQSNVGVAKRKSDGKVIRSQAGILSAIKRDDIELTRTGIGYNEPFRRTTSKLTVDGQEVTAPVGVVKVARLAHIAREKLSYYTEVKYNRQGVQLRAGYGMADNMFHFYKNNCKQTIVDVMRDSDRGRVDCILFTLGYQMNRSGIKQIRDRVTIDPTKGDRIPKFARKHGFVIAQTADFPRNVTPDNIDIETTDTVLDRRIRDSFMALLLPKWLSCEITIDRVPLQIRGGDYLILPPMNVFNLADGTMTANTVQNLVVRLVRQMNSSVTPEIRFESCRSLLFAIYSTVSGKLFRKGGLIRKMLFPRTSFTGYGVIVPNPDIAVDEILLPYSMVKHLAEKFNAYQTRMFNIKHTMSRKEMDANIRGYVLATRFPAHRERNSIALRPRVWREYAFGINPAIVGMQDGDFDGDMELVYFPKTITSMREIAKHFSLENHIGIKGVQIDKSRALRGLGDISGKSMEEITQLVKKELFKSTGLGEERAGSDRYLRTVGGLAIDSNDRATFAATIIARHDVSYMKAGAANAGNIGLSLRALSESPDELRIANEIYHILAQTALDGKNSEGDRSFVEKVCRALRMGTWEVRSILETPGDFSDEQKDFLRRKLFNRGRLTGTAMLVATEHPIAHATMTGNMRDIIRAKEIDPGAGCYEFLYHHVNEKQRSKPDET